MMRVQNWVRILAALNKSTMNQSMQIALGFLTYILITFLTAAKVELMETSKNTPNVVECLY